MRKIIILFLTLFLSMSYVSAETITKTLTTLGVNKSAISVSVKDVKNGNSIFSLNSKTPRIPASTQKLITSSASLSVLGEDYAFSTALYKSTNNDLYLKLSGDPLLASKDLEQLIITAKEKQIVPKKIYIDDSIFDNVEWGDGWQWDDDLNPLMPKFSAYNLNRNLVRLEIMPTLNNMPASYVVKPFYPISFVNLVVTDKSKQNFVKIERNNSIAPNMVNLSGYVSKSYSAYIPVNNPKRYFILQLENIISTKKFEYFGSILNAQLPKENIYLVDNIEHDIKSILGLILKNSNNFASESLFKHASAVYSSEQATNEIALKMLDDYFKKINLCSDDVKIVDASGVSKNNLMTTEFMTDFLVSKAKDENFAFYNSLLPGPGEGTLKDRMLYLKDNLKAKTGTLSDSSAIAGYITTRRGKIYAFDIMINDAKTTVAEKKNIEEQIIRNIYTNY